MYYNGEGVTENYSQALKWFRKAADKGNAEAQDSIGTMYYEGKGVTENYSRALKWLRKPLIRVIPKHKRI